MAEADELELAYIGGLLKLDIKVDTEAERQVREQLASKAKRRPSPNRKG